MNFAKWAKENGYRDDLTLDRIDNDGNYTPENCQWISNTKQQWNKRSNRKIEYCGQVKTLKEWSEILGINYKTLQKRLNTWGIERAMTEGVKR